MVLTHTTNHTYAHPFPTVTLAYFLRYCSPQLNPFAKHVLSTDTISSHVDPDTGRLHTTRIHLKKSRLPPAVFKLLPVSITGGNEANKASYILETSVVDMREGWMSTESRNLNFVGVLSVVERQVYTVPRDNNKKKQEDAAATTTTATTTTDVETTVVFRSRLGDKIRGRLGQVAEKSGEDGGGGFLARLGARGIQRSIESLASTKTVDQLGKSREGMGIILERLRQNGVMGVLEVVRRARERGMDNA